MGTKRHKPEEIVTKLRQVEVLAAKTVNSKLDCFLIDNHTRETADLQAGIGCRYGHWHLPLRRES